MDDFQLQKLSKMMLCKTVSFLVHDYHNFPWMNHCYAEILLFQSPHSIQSELIKNHNVTVSHFKHGWFKCYSKY